MEYQAQCLTQYEVRMFHLNVSNLNQTLYCPTNAYNVKNVELLKEFKIMAASPTCFGLQGNHQQGATAST